MVLRYYKLREQPFGVTPDSRYLYASATHREALASMLYAIDSGLGFVALIAQPGMGKTTLAFETLRQLQDKARTVFLFQTIATPTDLVRALLIDLGVTDTQGSLIDLQATLNQILVEQAATGRRLVVVIDEAQNLDDSVLELVRMLSNFETARAKLMQIVLSGQPQLRDKLASPHLLQLRQRISIFAHLQPLSAEETSAYIDHRLRIAGYVADKPLFTSGAVALIAKHSEGIPRNINNICFNALSLGCALQRTPINADVIQEVLADLRLDGPSFDLGAGAAPSQTLSSLGGSQPGGGSANRRVPPLAWKIALACAIVLPVGGFLLGYHRGEFASGPVRASAGASAGTSASRPSMTTANPVSERSAGAAPTTGDTQPAAAPAAIPANPQPLAHASAPSVAAPNTSSPVAATDTLPAAAVHTPPSADAGTMPSAPTVSTQSASSKIALPPVAQQVTPVPSSASVAPAGMRWVKVRTGQTLQGICAATFGSCAPAALLKIQRMNPSLLDPDYIKRGQKILLPQSRSDLLGNHGSLSHP